MILENLIYIPDYKAENNIWDTNIFMTNRY